MDISRRKHIGAGAPGHRSDVLGVAAFAMTAALVGCGVSDSQESADAEAVAPSTPEATVSASTAPPTAPAGDGLTGYGATRETWDGEHDLAPGYNEGAAFLPLVNGDQPRYAAVIGEAGRQAGSASTPKRSSSRPARTSSRRSRRCCKSPLRAGPWCGGCRRAAMAPRRHCPAVTAVVLSRRLKVPQIRRI